MLMPAMPESSLFSLVRVLLVDVRYQPLGAPHVVGIRGTERIGQCVFFDGNAIAERDERGHYDEPEREPVVEAQREAEEGEQGAGVRRVADAPIRAGVND